MQVYFNWHGNRPIISSAEVEYILRKHDITYGIDYNALTSIAQTYKIINSDTPKDQNTLVAHGTLPVDGHVRLHKYEMNVSPLVIMDQISPCDEPLSFESDVHIKGNVSGPVTINTTGDLLIDGFVNDAEIHCGGNLLLKGGINATSITNSSTVNKWVISKFFEYVTLHADGNISFGSSLNSNLSSYGEIISYGKREVSSVEPVMRKKVFVCRTSVTRWELKQHFHWVLMIISTFKKWFLTKKYQKKAYITQLTNVYEEACQKHPNQSTKQRDLFLKVKDAIYVKNQELSAAQKKKEQIQKRQKRSCCVRFRCHKNGKRTVPVRHFRMH